MKRLDVRPMMAAGGEPFDAIMSAVGGLEPGETFELTAPLEPVPLYALLAGRGFEHATEDLGGGDYRVMFTPGAGAVAASEPVVASAAALARYSDGDFGRRVLLDGGRMRVVLAAFEPGQEIPVHAPGVDLAMSVLEGVGEVRAGERTFPVRAGDVVVVPAGQARGVRARTRMITLHTVSPPPSDADHRAVEEAGRWPAPEPGPDLGRLILTEHAGLFPRVAELGRLAEEAGSLPEVELGTRLADALDFLTSGLLPHADEEERSIYPALDGVLRATGGATATMSADHVRIRALIEELARLASREQTPEARRREQALLFGLEAVLDLHFTKENERYVPLLDLLPARERHSLHAHLTGGGDTA